MALVTSVMFMPAAKVGALGSVRLWSVSGKLESFNLAQSKPSKIAKGFNQLRKERSKVAYDLRADKALLAVGRASERAARAAQFKALHGAKNGRP